MTTARVLEQWGGLCWSPNTSLSPVGRGRRDSRTSPELISGVGGLHHPFIAMFFDKMSQLQEVLFWYCCCRGRSPEWYNKAFGHLCVNEAQRIRSSFLPTDQSPEAKNWTLNMMLCLETWFNHPGSLFLVLSYSSGQTYSLMVIWGF